MQSLVPSRLTVAAIHRPGFRDGSVSRTERWSWDFIVDGASLFEHAEQDVMGALGDDDRAWNETVARRLLGQSEPDLPPNRVALYVCPECGDLSCGALTAALTVHGDTVTWGDFRPERDWHGAPGDRMLGIGPFVFDLREYEAVVMTAAQTSARDGTPLSPAS